VVQTCPEKPSGKLQHHNDMHGARGLECKERRRKSRRNGQACSSLTQEFEDGVYYARPGKKKCDRARERTRMREKRHLQNSENLFQRGKPSWLRGNTCPLSVKSEGVSPREGERKTFILSRCGREACKAGDLAGGELARASVTKREKEVALTWD